MAKSVENLRTEIENLDENKILRNFENIRELLEMAQNMGADKKKEENKSENNSRANQTQQTIQQNGTQNTSAVAQNSGNVGIVPAVAIPQT